LKRAEGNNHCDGDCDEHAPYPRLSGSFGQNFTVKLISARVCVRLKLGDALS
jgi:hypothetical protein